MNKHMYFHDIPAGVSGPNKSKATKSMAKMSQRRYNHDTRSSPYESKLLRAPSSSCSVSSMKELINPWKKMYKLIVKEDDYNSDKNEFVRD